MDKSPEAFRTISEVAEALDTPAHVLRFWETRFPQIRPVKRAGGRRYYRPSDLALLAGIKRLLHDEGMTIRGVQKILREQGVRHVAGLSDEASAEEEALISAMTSAGKPREAEVARLTPREANDASINALEAEADTAATQNLRAEKDPGTGQDAGTGAVQTTAPGSGRDKEPGHQGAAVSATVIAFPADPPKESAVPAIDPDPRQIFFPGFGHEPKDPLIEPADQGATRESGQPALPGQDQTNPDQVAAAPVPADPVTQDQDAADRITADTDLTDWTTTDAAVPEEEAALPVSKRETTVGAPSLSASESHDAETEEEDAPFVFDVDHDEDPVLTGANIAEFPQPGTAASAGAEAAAPPFEPVSDTGPGASGQDMNGLQPTEPVTTGEEAVEAGDESSANDSQPSPGHTLAARLRALPLGHLRGHLHRSDALRVFSHRLASLRLRLEEAQKSPR